MKPLLPAILLIGLIVGCGDDHPVKMPNVPNPHQAEQNQRDAELQKQLVEGSKRLVEADAQSRDKFLAMQDHLRADQASSASNAMHWKPTAVKSLPNATAIRLLPLPSSLSDFGWLA